jgi:hypothetical protein
VTVTKRFRFLHYAEKGAAHYALDNLPNKVLAAEYHTVLPDEAMIVQELERTIAELDRRTDLVFGRTPTN